MRKPTAEEVESSGHLAQLLESTCPHGCAGTPRFLPDEEDSEELGDHFDDEDYASLRRFYEEVKKHSEGLLICMMACETMLDNCADPQNHILDFKPEIKSAMEAYQKSGDVRRSESEDTERRHG